MKLTSYQQKVWEALKRGFMTPEVQLLTAKEAKEYCDDPTATRGWYHRLSASGYLDCTDWTGPFKTEELATIDCIEWWENDVDVEDED